ncbi:MAG: anthranilate phosphoribosyltransferase [Chloroflexi bacterium]|nr:anthranilate phosphoribosyltransferase [Chloroflexota bacterium]
MTAVRTDPEAIKPLLRDLGQGPSRGRSLSREEARFCLDQILDGRATEAQSGAFLLLQRYKGETPEELLGFIDAIRGRTSTHLIRPKVEGLLDVGSPYDGRLRHLVVSPAASIVAAACGVPVLLHGEEGVPPKHGLTIGAVLDELGVPTNDAPDAVERSIEAIGIGFLRQTRFAPDLAALRRLRDEIALRSPLNMVEKMYDPAGAPYHLIGLTHLPYLDKLGGALAGMGFRKTALVQGLEGHEDLPTSRGVRVIEFSGADRAEMNEYRVKATDYGLAPAQDGDLAPGGPDGGRPSADRSVELTLQVLQREASAAWTDLVAFSAGFRVALTGRAADLEEGVRQAQRAIESGDGWRLLERWRKKR